MAKHDIPGIVIGRLPIYLRAIHRMAQEGQRVTSSQELGKRLGVSAAQIRKDLSQFGEFGKQGTGYNIKYLSQQLRRILNLDVVWGMAIVGAGDVGSALAHYQGFRDRGFEATMIFDNDPEKVGERIGALIVQDLANLGEAIHEGKIKVAMVATPADHAQEVTDQLVEAGIKAILNYAPIQITVPEGVRVEYIDPATHLQKMSYYLK
ncbi:MAG: redox-sensing transcriptional repressor Rex [Anaerolineales bacterium]|nr:redox-sensing transcriptional repressor Rex [Chloroflexota bacterium]MBL6982223.1 redox-sensing transcriptional repressor Rex [Anaerolineales bacterium]